VGAAVTRFERTVVVVGVVEVTGATVVDLRETIKWIWC